MRWLKAWFRRLGGMFHKEQRDRDFAAEIESHLQMHMEDNLSTGMKPQAARRDALMRLGGVEQTKEAYREQRSLPWLDALFGDLHFALRMLAAKPGFSAVAILTLALGIGASTAVFSVVDRVLFRSLPYPQDDRLISFGVKAPFEGIEFMLAPEYAVLRSQSTPFESMTSTIVPMLRGWHCFPTDCGSHDLRVTRELQGRLFRWTGSRSGLSASFPRSSRCQTWGLRTCFCRKPWSSRRSTGIIRAWC